MTLDTPTGGKGGLSVLSPEDIFRFDCRRSFDCFTRCCRDITIFLTPYDIIRMKNALQLSSGEFLSRHTMTMITDSGLPVVALKMQPDDEKSCPFVNRNGCRIYPDRPWACRLYPLQPESTKITEKAGKAYYSVIDVPFCCGLEADRAVTLADWIEEQGIPYYLQMEAPFKKVVASDRLTQATIKNKKIQEMIYMACYDLDRFRRFVLESTFLERFEVDPQDVEIIKTDDSALYQLALRWLEYGLLAQHVLKVKSAVWEAGKVELGIE
ncbi:MAG: YkgJ family cysteine cluster protein [Desulfobacterales bacterium]|jgi:Fe-S-cluster containining protein